MEEAKASPRRPTGTLAPKVASADGVKTLKLLKTLYRLAFTIAIHLLL